MATPQWKISHYKTLLDRYYGVVLCLVLFLAWLAPIVRALSRCWQGLNNVFISWEKEIRELELAQFNCQLIDAKLLT